MKLRNAARRISTDGVLSSIQRSVFGYGFQIGFGIAIEYQLSVCYRVIVDQIVRLRLLIYCRQQDFAPYYDNTNNKRNSRQSENYLLLEIM